LHVCPACGMIESRDLNAALNIRARATSVGLNAPVVKGRVQEAQVF
jgi:transposase